MTPVIFATDRRELVADLIAHRVPQRVIAECMGVCTQRVSEILRGEYRRARYVVGLEPLSVRATNALLAAGLRTRSDVQAAVDAGRMQMRWISGTYRTSIPRIGPKVAQEIERWLNEGKQCSE